MLKNHSINNILIINFGSQYTQLIARRIRDIGVYCEVYSFDISKETFYKLNPMGIILSGSPESILDNGSPRLPDFIFQIGIPILGICYGMQLMAIQLGGKVGLSKKHEFGYSKVFIKDTCNLFHDAYDGINKNYEPFINVWMSHTDKVISIPPNFKNIGYSDNCEISIMIDDRNHFYGIQFHPEVTHTQQGSKILKNFILDICKCKKQWVPTVIIDNIVRYLSKKLKNDKVILAFSGGIDSFVSAMLLHHAIGNRLVCIFIDNGLLRSNEVRYIQLLLSNFKFNVKYVFAEDRFLTSLSNVDDPELKRIIIGRIFVEILHEEAHKIKQVKWLAQGTIYSDIIESSKFSSKEYKIKSHHNVAGLPVNMKLNLIEPIKYLFKDEVKKIALTLGLSFEIINRHPFPGPGLGIRIIGVIKKIYCDILRHADSIFIEELYKANLYYKLSQAFVIFLPIRSVGVVGDRRQYNWILSLRAVETVDFMTANWAILPYEFLGIVSNRIINEVCGVSRVVYDITGKPPATIEWE